MSTLKRLKRREEIIEGALKLFSKGGFYQTTIPDIARTIGMSVGNFYNYFTSKEVLAKELLLYISEYLGERIRTINESDATTQEKIRAIVAMYFEMVQSRPEMIEYFLRIFLSNREVFGEGCEGTVCVSAFITEMMLFFDDGVSCGDLREQDFFSAFGLFMGYLGGMAFLCGEKVLPHALDSYVDSITQNIYRALKT
ncbi:MAG: TetR/AcrR family transcriptional regulator [Campylobacterales bacterium]|nr:TetR/AcrR family transcriptional regulator [Campylobacterales bacterium]